MLALVEALAVVALPYPAMGIFLVRSVVSEYDLVVIATKKSWVLTEPQDTCYALAAKTESGYKYILVICLWPFF